MADEKKIRAEQIIDKYDGWFGGTFGIDESGLGSEISTIVLNAPGVVFYVFSGLIGRRYDSATIIGVARILVDSTSQAILNQVAADWDGYQLVKLVEKILKCDLKDNKTAARCESLYSANIRGLQAMRLNAGGKKQAQTNGNSTQPTKLSSVVMDWYEKYNDSPIFSGSPLKRNKFDKNICWDLPSKGPGFVGYNIDDLKGNRKDEYGYDQIGTKETVEAMIQIAGEWINLHPDKTLEYGDISRPGGIDTPDHSTHNNGKAFDMRLLRKDNSKGGFSYTQTGIYSQELTKAFILFVIKLYPGTRILFNDKQLNEIDRETKDFVNPSGGHHNHLHIIFPGGN